MCLCIVFVVVQATHKLRSANITLTTLLFSFVRISCMLVLTSHLEHTPISNGE